MDGNNNTSSSKTISFLNNQNYIIHLNFLISLTKQSLNHPKRHQTKILKSLKCSLLVCSEVHRRQRPEKLIPQPNVRAKETSENNNIKIDNNIIVDFCRDYSISYKTALAWFFSFIARRVNFEQNITLLSIYMSNVFLVVYKYLFS